VDQGYQQHLGRAVRCTGDFLIVETTTLLGKKGEKNAKDFIF
jgi:hypothetical protein